jgi:hypothetical protein
MSQLFNAVPVSALNGINGHVQRVRDLTKFHPSAKMHNYHFSLLGWKIRKGIGGDAFIFRLLQDLIRTVHARSRFAGLNINIRFFAANNVSCPVNNTFYQVKFQRASDPDRIGGPREFYENIMDNIFCGTGIGN